MYCNYCVIFPGGWHEISFTQALLRSTVSTFRTKISMPLQTNISIPFGGLPHASEWSGTVRCRPTRSGPHSPRLLTFWESLRRRSSNLVGCFEPSARTGSSVRDPQALLVIDNHAEQAISQFQTTANEFGDARLRECADRLVAWLEARLRIPADDLFLLQHYIYLEWMLRITPDKVAGACIRLVQIKMFGLLENRPAGFRQALKGWKPMLDPMSPEGRTALQAHGRIMHGVFCSIRERAADNTAARYRIKTLLEAWREAYENVNLRRLPVSLRRRDQRRHSAASGRRPRAHES